MNVHNGRKIWCYCHSRGSHSDDECHYQERDGRRKECSTADSTSKKDETFIADSTLTDCGKKQCYVTVTIKSKRNLRTVMTNLIRRLASEWALQFVAYHYRNKPTVFNFY